MGPRIRVAVLLRWQERILAGTTMPAPDSHFLVFGGKPGDRYSWHLIQRPEPGAPDNLGKLGPFYNVLVSGLAFSPDGKSLVVASRRWLSRRSG